IDEKILDLINDLGEYKTLKYVYNNNNDFIPGVTQIYYSGPYWTNDEIIAAIKSLLIGSWLASGENVIKFENELCRKINTKNSFMCNSGSS
ncbi:DegT/DnrJ/EryC1/StrS family aminotransferase, partial [Enterococcus faecium]|uniref:DegT/DnrJ/EryC1/StrS family aminotransferase n=1 Tax=Enterococcus faecium TaxID=1352 RepID=UPI003DA007D3